MFIPEKNQIRFYFDDKRTLVINKLNFKYLKGNNTIDSREVITVQEDCIYE
jgi:hypothetical protein